MSFARYGVYYLPPEGPLAAFGASWLGWDVARACAVRQPEIAGLEEVTRTPRKYGFHATLKPPFRLTEGRSKEELEAAVAEMAGGLAPAGCAGLEVTPLGRFLALTLRGDTGGVDRIAAACVRTLDGFRAAPTDEETARRRKSRLSERQEAMLSQWGYPHVMAEFRFHMTLTGRLQKADVPGWTDRLRAALPPLPAPFRLDEVALVGERASDGRFELIRRYPLSGPGVAKGSSG